MDYTVRVFDFSTPFLVGNKSSLSALHVNANLERRTEWNTAYTGFRMYRVDHHREWTMQISLQEVVPPPFPRLPLALCPVFSLNNRPLDDFVAPQIANIVRTSANPNQRHRGRRCSSVNVTSRVSRSLSMHPSKTILARYSCLERAFSLSPASFSKLRFASFHPRIVKFRPYCLWFEL